LTKDEALKQAREWIKAQPRGWMTDGFKEVIADIEQALAQPAQEPVAWSWVPSEDWGSYFTEDASKAAVMRERGLEVRPLYTTPPAAQPAQEPEPDELTLATVYMSGLLDGKKKRPWVGLTEEEIEREFGFIDELLRDCVRRTEAKLKDKNT